MGSATTEGAGLGLSGLTGMIAAHRTQGASNNALNEGQLGGDIGQLQNLLFSVNDLLRMGRIQPGDVAPLGSGGVIRPGDQNSIVRGLGPNDSVIGKMLQAYMGNLSAADPTFAATQKAIQGGLNFDSNGLPADYARSLTQGIRANASSRGLLDSGTSAIQEAVALAGGSENIRNERLTQAQNFLGQTSLSFIDKLFPSISTLYGGELSRAETGSKNALGAAGVGADVYGTGAKATG